MRRDQRPDAGDQVLAVLNRVRPRVVAADQQARRAQLVVFDHRLRHRFGRADERGGIALRAGRGGKRGPQAGVVDFGFGGGLQQPPGTDILALRCRRAAAIGENPVEDRPGTVPGRAFGRRQDRARRQAEGGAAAGKRRLAPHAVHEQRGVLERLAP